jgi:hypothetical protein
MSKPAAGRHEVPASQRRELILRFVVTSTEFHTIRTKAKELRLSLSEYLRQAVLKG